MDVEQARKLQESAKLTLVADGHEDAKKLPKQAGATRFVY